MIEILESKKIGVVMGGLSAEKEVSMTSGNAVLAALKEAGYNAHPIVYSGPGIVEELRRVAPDVVFLALHGRYGEDGTFQGLLETMGIPYTGAGVIGSAIAMDKSVTKKILKYHGIPTADFVTHHRDGFEPKNNFAGCLGYPLVVKPSNLGSTIGMSFVYKAEELMPAIELGFRHDEEIVLERFIEGREITAGILDGKKLPLVEIITPGGVYDYKLKYQSHETRYVCPAEVDEKTTAMLQGIAMDVFAALHGYGVGRVDFRLDKENRPFVLEMNTLPGMTGTSLLPKAAAAAGMDFISLIEAILVSGLNRK